jgi:signal transduction histidine kinase
LRIVLEVEFGPARLPFQADASAVGCGYGGVMEAEGPPRAGLWMGRRLTPGQVDWLVVAGAVALSLPALVHAALLGDKPVAIGLATLPLGTVPLRWRRSHPGPVLAVLAVAYAVPAIFGHAEPNSVGLLLGVGSAALYGDRRVRLAAGTAALGALLAAFAVVLATGAASALGHLAIMAFGSGVAWVVGDRTRIRQAYLAQLEERAARLEREQHDHAHRAADAERSRIARELHDVIAHNVSVIAVQAGAARVAAPGSPAQAAETLGTIERTARSTLAELRALLGMLRRSDGQAPSRGPRPTLAQLDGLVTRSREAGLHIEVRVEGSLEVLPATVDLSAYRIVQEALTNVMKHAPGARVHLLVRRTGRAVEVIVVDDGPGPAPGPPSGQGLIGMRERASLVGGTLTAGPALGGGFRVAARLPLEPARAAGTAPPADERSAEVRVP